MSLKCFTFILALLSLQPSISNAAFDLNILDPAELGGEIPADVANEAIKTFGIFFVHRPYDGAVSMFGSSSMDFKFEVTLMKVGNGIFEALEANNMSSSQTESTVALPMAKVHFRKPLSPAMDIGVSGLYYQGQYAIGTDLKAELDDPEEGISTAVRLSYSYATSTLLYVKSVTVFSADFVASRKLDFASPYLGVGGRYITGTLAVPFSLPPLDDFTVEKTGSGYTAFAYTGITFQILGPKGFRLGMEGTYDISGFSSIGTIFGIGF